jgi:hypothetical protein
LKSPQEILFAERTNIFIAFTPLRPQQPAPKAPRNFSPSSPHSKT